MQLAGFPSIKINFLLLITDKWYSIKHGTLSLNIPMHVLTKSLDQASLRVLWRIKRIKADRLSDTETDGQTNKQIVVENDIVHLDNDRTESKSE